MGYGFTSEMKVYFDGECQGDGWAAYKLSCEMDRNGFDDVFVQNHCRKAAELGCSSAYVALGTYALRDNLLEDYSVMSDKHYQDQSKCVDLFRTASMMNNNYGKFMYGQCLLNGIFTQRDECYARTLIEEAVPYLSEEDIINMVAEIDRYVGRIGFNPTPSGSMAMKVPMTFLGIKRNDIGHRKAS